MHGMARVVGLETHLTSPTRNNAHLVDLWIALEWLSCREEWTKEFITAVERHNALSSSLGCLQLVTMSERQGWIAARGVNLQVVDASDVEALACGIVAQVNEGLAASPATAEPPKAEATWPSRLRASMASSGALLAGLRLPPRRRDEADA
ncbi:MAG: hypothetical protein JWM95_4130 [Gemmatimonadetes bacterium]|nr:hypothetical protein [Gemmatimonadota bacterium]